MPPLACGAINSSAELHREFPPFSSTYITKLCCSSPVTVDEKKNNSQVVLIEANHFLFPRTRTCFITHSSLSASLGYSISGEGNTSVETLTRPCVHCWIRRIVLPDRGAHKLISCKASYSTYSALWISIKPQDYKCSMYPICPWTALETTARPRVALL